MGVDLKSKKRKERKKRKKERKYHGAQPIAGQNRVGGSGGEGGGGGGWGELLALQCNMKCASHKKLQSNSLKTRNAVLYKSVLPNTLPTGHMCLLKFRLKKN